MSIPGPAVHQQLLDAYAKVQSYLESERDSILNAKGQRDELADDRNHALDSLAQHYLPELTPDAISQTWVEVRDRMTQILRRKEDHVRRLDLELGELDQRRKKLDQQLITINETFDAARRTQDEIARKVEQELGADADFRELADRAAMAESALERAEANLQEIDQESARKLPAYDDSSLFRYLYDRGYGTEKYRSRGLTRQMDRWLARYIDYSRARQSYDFLSQTPDHMRRIIAEDREALRTVMVELEKRRDQVSTAHGLPAAIARTEQVAAERQACLDSVDEVMEQTQQKRVERDAVADGRGTYYQEAIQLFREFLKTHQLSELRRRAEQTEAITDDQIVARLAGVDIAMEQLDDAARQQRGRLDQMQSFLDGLARVIQRFRAAQFDTSRSNFLSSLNIEEEVARAHETADTDDLWRRIRRAQRWGPIDEEQPETINPMHRVLVNAMTQAAQTEHADPARRAGTRHTQQHASSQPRS